MHPLLKASSYRFHYRFIKRHTEPWKRGHGDVLKTGLGLKVVTPNELLTKLPFFFLKPLRRIAKLEREVLDNFFSFLSVFFVLS
jgi:hypothetical protein